MPRNSAVHVLASTLAMQISEVLAGASKDHSDTAERLAVAKDALRNVCRTVSHVLKMIDSPLPVRAYRAKLRNLKKGRSARWKKSATKNKEAGHPKVAGS